MTRLLRFLRGAMSLVTVLGGGEEIDGVDGADLLSDGLAEGDDEGGSAGGGLQGSCGGAAGEDATDGS